MTSAKLGWDEQVENWGTAHAATARDEHALIKTDSCCQLHTQRVRR
jgi:hypothetical protein